MCKTYVNYRQVWYQAMTLPDNFDTMSLDDRFKVVFNEPVNIKPTANFIANSFSERQKILSNL